MSVAGSGLRAASARRTLLIMLLGPALGLAIPELLVRHSDVLWTSLAQRPEQRGIGLLRLARPGDASVVALGSSVAFEAIDERHLESCLRPIAGRTLNLGMPHNPAAGCAMELPRVLRLKPRAIVYVTSAEDLATTLVTKLTQTYQPWIAWRLFPLGHFMEHAEWHLYGATGWSSVIHQHRSWIRYVLEHGQKSYRPPREELPVTPAAEREALARGRFRSERPRLGPFGPNVRALRLMARTARDAGVALVVFQAPTYPVIATPAGEPLCFNPELERLLEQLAEQREAPEADPSRPAIPRGLRDGGPSSSSAPLLARQAGFHHIPARRLGAFGPEAFRDATHLSRDGRRRLTEALAGELRPLLENARAVQ